jgi:hypothetical protein
MLLEQQQFSVLLQQQRELTQHLRGRSWPGRRVAPVPRYHGARSCYGTGGALPGARHRCRGGRPFTGGGPCRFRR